MLTTFWDKSYDYLQFYKQEVTYVGKKEQDGCRELMGG